MKKKFPWVLAMIQPSPLPGSYLHQGEPLSSILQQVLAEAELLKELGYDGFILQNMHDGPLRQQAELQTTAYMTLLASELKHRFPELLLGILVNWDGVSSLCVADAVQADFIRIEHLYTGVGLNMCGFMEGQCADILALKKKLGSTVPIYADVQEVNGTYLYPQPKEKEALRMVKRAFADGLFTSGSTTEESLDLARRIKSVLPEVPLLLGGKATAENIAELLSVYDGVSVATWIKDGDMRNPVNREKAAQFCRNAKTAIRKEEPHG